MRCAAHHVTTNSLLQRTGDQKVHDIIDDSLTHPYPDVFLSLKAQFTQCHFIHQDCFGVNCPVLEIPRDNKMEPIAICLA